MSVDALVTGSLYKDPGWSAGAATGPPSRGGEGRNLVQGRRRDAGEIGGPDGME
jgi:hypothetical protein